MRKLLIVLLLVLPIVYAQSCVSGQTKCDGSSFMACSKSVWQVSSECKYGCDSRSGCLPKDALAAPLKQQVYNQSKWKVCPEGDTRCVGIYFQACKNDAWKTQMTCGNQQVCYLNGCANKQIEQSNLSALAVRNCMACPEFEASDFQLPPFDETGDCSLIGKDVASYVKSLEGLSVQCNLRLPDVMQHVFIVKAGLIDQLSQLPVGTEPAPDFSCFVNGPPAVEPPCPSELIVEPKKSVIVDEKGREYSAWLERLRDNTLEYCKATQELEKPLIDECGKIKLFSETCRGTRPGTIAEYKSGIDSAFKRLQDNSAEADSLFDKMKADFANFRNSYKEESLDCKSKSESLPAAIVHEDTIVDKIVKFFKKIFGFLG